MNIYTRIFGEVEVDAAKIITFPSGIIGFPDLKQFLLIHDEERQDGNISWLQSIDEPAFALPVIDPLRIMEDYNPVVEDELLEGLGELNQSEMLVLVTITVPGDITKMTVNLKAPIVINASNLRAGQLIVDDEKYAVRYPIYDILKGKKEGKPC